MDVPVRSCVDDTPRKYDVQADVDPIQNSTRSIRTIDNQKEQILRKVERMNKQDYLKLWRSVVGHIREERLWEQKTLQFEYVRNRLAAEGPGSVAFWSRAEYAFWLNAAEYWRKEYLEASYK